MSSPQKITRLATPEKFSARLAELGIDLPFDAEIEPNGPLSAPLEVAGHRIGNRFAVLPMEGWDATEQGRPTDLVRRRWTRFGESGAKLVWGGEAYAVSQEGRANPNQLCANAETEVDLHSLREALLAGHRATGSTTDDLMIGLQLTHSGRFARPKGQPAPRIAASQTLLDGRVGLSANQAQAAVLSDGEIQDVIEAYARLAQKAAAAGFDFVDVKACHGYLGHEFLSAYERPGPYGGDFEGRTRFLRETIAAVGQAAPSLTLGCRLSVFDFPPFERGPAGKGQPQSGGHRPFGAAENGSDPIPSDALQYDLREPHQLLEALTDSGVELICTTAGSPYYNPHIQRPAFYPPSDGYAPPEDPLVGVDRQRRATAELKSRHPRLLFVGSGYSYLQEWLPQVAQATIRQGQADLIGLGRMMLSYPGLPRDVLERGQLERPLICRTFSDCTTAPRNGLVSGCYPIDPEYKRRPEADVLAAAKRAAKEQTS